MILECALGSAMAGGPAYDTRLSKVSKDDFLKSALGKEPAFQSLAAGLVAPPPDSSDKNRAPRFYLSSDQKYGLVEACVASTATAAGLYVLFPGASVGYYRWYDPSFNEWACTEGCNEDKDCYYEAHGLTPNGPIQRLDYHYEINLQGGQYDLELEKDHHIKVLKKQTADLT